MIAPSEAYAYSLQMPKEEDLGYGGVGVGYHIFPLWQPNRNV